MDKQGVSERDRWKDMVEDGAPPAQRNSLQLIEIVCDPTMRIEIQYGAVIAALSHNTRVSRTLTIVSKLPRQRFPEGTIPILVPIDDDSFHSIKTSRNPM